MAESVNQLAILLKKQKREESATFFREALEIQRRFAHEYPKQPQIILTVPFEE